MARYSLTKVSSWLVEFGAATKPFTTREYKKRDHRPCMAPGFVLDDETYGRNSEMYLDCPDKDTKDKLTWFLKSKGVTINDAYGRANSRTVNFGVSYFKGFHWDE